MFFTTTAGIVILSTGGSMIGGTIMYYLKKPFSMGMKTLEYLYYKRKAHNLVKKGILDEKRQKVTQGFYIIKDKEYADFRIYLKKIYNLTDLIIRDDDAFKQFYGIEDTRDRVMRYCRDNSLTIVENSILEISPPPPIM